MDGDLRHQFTCEVGLCILAVGSIGPMTPISVCIGPMEPIRGFMLEGMDPLISIKMLTVNCLILCEIIFTNSIPLEVVCQYECGL